MKFNFILLFTTISFLGFQAKSQTEKSNADTSIEVYDFDEKKELFKYENLNLDKDHPNLLNPEISKSDMNKVIDSWSDLHQSIAKFLQENNFKWHTKDPEIKIVHKFYFEPDGKIKSYFFRIFNDEISKTQRKTYSDLIVQFAKSHRIDITKDHQFAQCGKTKYMNQ